MSVKWAQYKNSFFVLFIHDNGSDNRYQLSLTGAERSLPLFNGPPDIATGYGGIGVWGVHIKAIGITSNLVTGKELNW